jgi:hypothetical protein
VDAFFGLVLLYAASGGYVGWRMWRARRGALKYALLVDWMLISLFAIVPVLNTITVIVLLADMDPDH